LGSLPIIKERLKEDNKNFHALRGFFKATINYPRQTRKLKGVTTSAINLLVYFGYLNEATKILVFLG
jgi:hypothetical protein